MSVQEKDGGPAFPGGELPEHPKHPNGMSLRDYVAIAALPQAILDYDRKTRVCPGADDWVLPYATRAVGSREDIIARQAYRYADAMLTARQKDTAP